MSYWVVGGEYADTTFEQPAAGKRIDRFGPFDNYKAAYEVWGAKAWATVDNCMCRFRIFKHDEDVNGSADVQDPHDAPHL